MPQELIDLLKIAGPSTFTATATWFFARSRNRVIVEQMRQAAESSEFDRLNKLTQRLEKQYDVALREISDMRKSHEEAIRKLEANYNEKLKAVGTEINRIR